MRFRCGAAQKSFDSTTAALSRKGRWLAAFAVLAFGSIAAGCGGDSDNDDGWYTLVLVPAPGTDPFADPTAEYLYLAIEDSLDTIVAEEEFPIDAEDLTLDKSPTGRELYFVVEVRNGLTPRGILAAGESGPHALVKDEHTTITVVLEEP
jgi:hypothetical protein